MSGEMITVSIIGLAVLALGVGQIMHTLSHKPVEHQHCFHWMHASDAGRIVYQHCCHCGVVLATHVIGQWGDQPWRYSDHGSYITYKAEVDYRNKTA